MNIKSKKMIWIALTIILFAAAMWGPLASRVEQAKYTLVQKQGMFEIRDYAPQIIAQVSVTGERKEAINEGFKLIADYIFGNNTSNSKIAMTAPVAQNSSEKIAMTAPVAQQGDGKNWTIHFVMPSNYTLSTLPKPNNAQVKILETPAKRFAAIVFSGFGKNQDLIDNTTNLTAFLAEKNIKTLSSPTYAFYNPPWTLPFLRRNEVLIEIEAK